MNTQAAIEAARIAAETAQRSSIITAVVTILTVLITSVITIRTARKSNRLAKELGEKNLKALEQKRYIDAISVERIKWINTMRDKFSDFLKNVHFQMGELNQLQSGNSEIDKDRMIKRYHEISYVGNHIYFLLNPTDPICIEIKKLQMNIFSSLSVDDISEYNSELLADLTDDLAFFYQVLLKAEWKRVKEENKRGEELDDETMNVIYQTIAKRIDSETYEKYLG